MTGPADAELRAWLALLLAPGLGPRRITKLLHAFGGPQSACEASTQALTAVGLSETMITALRNPDAVTLEAALAWAEHEDATVLTRTDPRYPSRLAEVPTAPPVLFVRGEAGLLQEPQLAVVGSRNPTPGGVQTTKAFASHLAGLGLVITSGMASGIDSAAHQGALETGRTIAVLGTGPDRVYPAVNRELARRIAAEGALVSEFPPGTGPQPSHFPRRNLTISGLSLGTLVTEAAPRSGSLITARYAAEQGREVFAVPGSIHNPLARGCHALIREGAKLIDSVDQLLEELAPQLQDFLASSAAQALPAAKTMSALDPQPPLAMATPGLDADYCRLLEGMGHDPVALDQLVERTGFSAQEVSSMLLLLELQGHVSCLPGGRFARRGD
ncbi:MAG: DNA-protecting protein DprA [Gammaproteobacteria bacterium]|jgi:DNA processing protein|nr:DNA-protecting protein DprA [Gammaproteobacteria bacterium]